MCFLICFRVFTFVFVFSKFVNVFSKFVNVFSKFVNVFSKFVIVFSKFVNVFSNLFWSDFFGSLYVSHSFKMQYDDKKPMKFIQAIFTLMTCAYRRGSFSVFSLPLAFLEQTGTSFCLGLVALSVILLQASSISVSLTSWFSRPKSF